MNNQTTDLPDIVNRGIDLGHSGLGTRIIECRDDFFADCNRLLNPEPSGWIENRFDDNGKWMDGWESRRRCSGGLDHLSIKPGRPGILFGVNIDTAHFTGNYPKAASWEGSYCDGEINGHTERMPLISLTELSGVSRLRIRGTLA